MNESSARLDSKSVRQHTRIRLFCVSMRDDKENQADNMVKLPKQSGTEAVDAYMRALVHPHKAEIEALRTIIKNADPKVQERVKWNAPSFYYHDDIAAFNPRAKGFVQLVLVFHRGKMIEDRHDLLEGEYRDRRLAGFKDMPEVLAKQDALTRVIQLWIAQTDLEIAQAAQPT
jgi:hypothetical protein